jgi:hypothetical protein
VKHATLREYGRRFGLRLLVETGTYVGDTVAALHDVFDRIVSVELDEALFQAAQRRFAGLDHVELVHGDSGDVMPAIVAGIDGPALFWLDGHYSAGITARGREDTPIIRELEAIFADREVGHVILVDDARCFTGQDGWPSVAELAERVRAHDPELVFEVDADIIRIHRPLTPSASAESERGERVP